MPPNTRRYLKMLSNGAYWKQLQSVLSILVSRHCADQQSAVRQYTTVSTYRTFKLCGTHSMYGAPCAGCTVLVLVFVHSVVHVILYEYWIVCAMCTTRTKISNYSGGNPATSQLATARLASPASSQPQASQQSSQQPASQTRAKVST